MNSENYKFEVAPDSKEFKIVAGEVKLWGLNVNVKKIVKVKHPIAYEQFQRQKNLLKEHKVKYEIIRQMFKCVDSCMEITDGFNMIRTSMVGANKIYFVNYINNLSKRMPKKVKKRNKCEDSSVKRFTYVEYELDFEDKLSSI